MTATTCVGLMSGTSLDGVDGVVARFADDGSMQVLAHAHEPFDAALHDELLALNAPGENEIHRAALAGNALARRYARAITALLRQAALAPSDIAAVGAHGQTVRHRPGEFDDVGYTVQLLNPSLLAELAGIDVVADLRGRDVAAHGQGAPLVPAFHRALFARDDRRVAVLNLGGIGNLTLLRPGEPTLGFDCGPGNVLMDLWCRRHRGQPFDDDGRWAATGHVDTALLRVLMDEPYLARPVPKSTGRDLFHADWLDAALARVGRTPAPVDVQATLAAYTVQAAVTHLGRFGTWDELLVCGGGAANGHLMRELAAALPAAAVMATDRRGLPASQVEACAFAWLAHAALERRSGNIASVTGARGERVLGALYPR